MIIFIEVVLLFDLIINLLTLLIIKELLFLKLKKSFLLSLIIDLVYMILYIFGYNLGIFIYIMPIIYVFISFKTNLTQFIKSIILYNILNYFLGGLAFNINLYGNIKYFLITSIYFILIIIFYIIFKRKEILISYDISFIFNKKKYNLSAFFDTGCNLLYKGYPVFIINKKYEFNNQSKEKFIFYTAVSSSEVFIYKIDNLMIKKRNISCYCIFLDIDYEAIIGFNFL